MNSYVITYNSVDNENKLLYGYETISGKDAMSALKNRFNKPLKRLIGDNGRYADVILVKGRFDEQTNNIIVNGRYTQLCYGVIQN